MLRENAAGQLAGNVEPIERIARFELQVPLIDHDVHRRAFLRRHDDARSGNGSPDRRRLTSQVDAIFIHDR